LAFDDEADAIVQNFLFHHKGLIVTWAKVIRIPVDRFLHLLS